MKVERDFSVIGASVPRVGGAEKVTGKARYAGDLVVPGMIEGKFLRSPYAHTRIVRIATEEGESLALSHWPATDVANIAISQPGHVSISAPA